MNNLTSKMFLIEAMLNGKSYDQISKDYQVDKKVLSDWWAKETDLRKSISEARSLYNTRQKGHDDKKYILNFGSSENFLDWYLKQGKKCAYCGIEEYKLKEIFDFENGNLKTKRHRGRRLELDRVNSHSNEYSATNCVLSCYLCNNHKSDLIDREDFIKYFKECFYSFQNDKYNQLIKTKVNK